MPHIDVKHFPRNLSEEEKKAVAEDLAVGPEETFRFLRRIAFCRVKRNPAGALER